MSKAYSGFEALEIMKRSRVDIVLTDIRMPGHGRHRADGTHFPRMAPLQNHFLTGYDDFDYVYQAIQKPGVSYILKTEGYQKVKNMVRAAVDQLDNELYMKDLVQQAQKKLNTLETLLQGEYLRHVLKGTPRAR